MRSLSSTIGFTAVRQKNTHPRPLAYPSCSLAADIEQLIERPRRAAKLHQTNRADCYGSNEDHADCACCEQRYSAVMHEGAYGVAAYGLTPNGLGA
jgi:hypothetical protein